MFVALTSCACSEAAEKAAAEGEEKEEEGAEGQELPRRQHLFSTHPKASRLESGGV